MTRPEQPNDADNTLFKVIGNEGAVDDMERFSERFASEVNDGYGSTEGGIFIHRVSGMPRNALGISLDENVKIMDRATVTQCPRAVFDESGELRNANKSIGEIVSLGAADDFEGYYKNPETNQKRLYKGMVWSGDLGYQDNDGYFYFAGRDDDWMRVDGENIASTQVEQLICRHPNIMLAAVYAVPDLLVGDSVMAALQLRDKCEFNVEQFDLFLAGQSDFGAKWKPLFIRVSKQLPATATSKILKRQLRLERWSTEDDIGWKSEKESSYRLMTAADKDNYTDRINKTSNRQL